MAETPGRGEVGRVEGGRSGGRVGVGVGGGGGGGG